MGTLNQSTEVNDYAIALYLNERAWKILWHVADLYPLQSKDMEKVNRNYVLLVQELSELYTNNIELKQLEPKPTWQRFRQIESNQVTIADLQENRTGDTGQAHTAEVRRLCIIMGKDKPELNDKQKTLTTEADEIITVLHKHAKEERKHLQALQQQKLEQPASKDSASTQDELECGDHIAKLSIAQKVVKLKLDGITYTFKRFNSTKGFNYRLMKYLLDRPDEWVDESELERFRMRTPIKDWPKLMGFTGEIKNIFIDVSTKEKKIMLNPKKSLTPDEAEIINKLVKTLNTK